MRTPALLSAALVLGLALSPAAGVSQTVERTLAADTGNQPRVEVTLVIEQFLRAVNAKDLGTMAKLFGTKDGSITKRDRHQDVERRMFALASILRHEDYAAQGAQVVPGRSGEATEVMVRMTIAGRMYHVPYTLVRTKDESWLIEQIDIEKITNRY